MRFYEVLTGTHNNILFNPSDTVIKCLVDARI